MRGKWPFYLLALTSGACALVYETAWLREFRLLFGASTLASATVLGLFMGGVGLGSYVLGPRVDRHPAPLLYYLQLEAWIALAAAISPHLMPWIQRAYIASGGSAALGPGLATGLRIALASLVLLLPTFLMGGTLPALARAAEGEESGRTKTALLYGANALGGVCGALVSTFYLLERNGNDSTLWWAACVNLGAVAAGHLLPGARAARAPSAATAAVEPSERPSWGEQVRQPVLWLAFGSGLVFFVVELLFYRILGPLLGGSVFTFGLILAVALFGLGAGGLLSGWAQSARSGPVVSLRGTFYLEALALAAPLAYGDRLALLAAKLQPTDAASFEAKVLGWATITAIVVLPVALIAGYQFPLFISAAGKGRNALGRQTGEVYAWNTAGAVIGSGLGGFWAISALGALGAWRSVIVLLFALALLADVFTSPSRARLSLRLALVWPALGALLFGLAFAPLGPTAAFRHSGIGVGRFQSAELLTENGEREFLHFHRRAQVWEADGRESSVALMRYQGLAFVVNGKVDGHATLDAATQIMAGLLGSLLHGHVQDGLVIGLGTGSTAGWLGSVPSVKKVDVFELEPSLLRVAKDTRAVNQEVLSNPKVHVQLGDGRELLITSRHKYDLIASEPSNPYRAGIASLFTREFYAQVREHLKPGGVFVQWLQVYEIDGQAISTVLATLGTAFPNIEVWRTHRDLLLVASEKPLNYQASDLRSALLTEPYRTGVPAAWGDAELEGVFAHFVANSELGVRVTRNFKGQLNTDDRSVLEFGFARSVNRHNLFSMSGVWGVAERTKTTPPRIADELDPALLTARRENLYGTSLKLSEATLPLVLRSRAMFTEAVRRAALGAHKLGPAEREALPRLLPEAEPLIAARDALGAGSYLAASNHLIRFFDRMHQTPWIDVGLASAALRLARTLPQTNRALAEPLFAALKEPFAAYSADDQRITTALALALMTGNKACMDVKQPDEPWVPWNRSYLKDRLRCETLAGKPKAAERDLEDFEAAAKRRSEELAKTSGRPAKKG